MKKIELHLEFTDLAELRIFMTSDFPFGRMTEGKASVEQADEIVKKYRKKKEEAVEAPVSPTIELVEQVPMASVPAAPIAAPVAPPVAPVPTSTPVPTAPAPAAVQTVAQTALGDAIAQAAPATEASALPAAPAPAPTPVPAAPASAAQPTPAPTATATYSMDDLRNAATKLLDEGRHGEIAQALQNHGVSSLKDLPVEQYSAFAADLRAMGASV